MKKLEMSVEGEIIRAVQQVRPEANDLGNIPYDHRNWLRNNPNEQNNNQNYQNQLREMHDNIRILRNNIVNRQREDQNRLNNIENHQRNDQNVLNNIENYERDDQGRLNYIENYEVNNQNNVQANIREEYINPQIGQENGQR